MLRLLIAVVLGLWAAALGAEPRPLVVPGEIVVAIRDADATGLRAYRHDKITHITFHHEGFAGDNADLFARASAARDRQTIQQRVLNINHDHVHTAGLSMFAYHYAVDKQGRIAKGRPVRFKPATRSTLRGSALRADFAGHFAVVALGDFNHERLTPAARLSYIRVMSVAQRAYRVPTANILPHSHHAATSCPGAQILAQADALARSVTTYSLQAEMAARGCLTEPPDGTLGPGTTRAFRSLVKAAKGALSVGQFDDTALFAILTSEAMRCR